MAWIGVVTNAGSQLLASWGSGSTLTITSAKTGTGTVAEALLITQTAVSSEKQTASIVSQRVTQTGREIKLQVPAFSEAYTLKQIGIFARVDSGTPALLALFQNTDGVAIPSIDQQPDFVYSFYATVNMANTGTFALTVDTSAVVSTSTLSEALAAKMDNINTLTAESSLADDDALPFYDSSAAAQRKTLWGNIKSKLEAYFDDVYAALVHVHSASDITSGTLPDARIASASSWNGKVDKIQGKGLSTNDYTTAEKNKVANLPADTNAALSGKQATLVSGTNIKTINSASLLGSGNINLAPAYQYSTTDLTAGTSALATGTLYFVYE